MKITKELIKSFNPCASGKKNCLEHYVDWEGSLSEFLELDKISTEDKLWVFTREIAGIEKLQRKWAVACAWKAAERADNQELYDFLGLIQTMYESVDWESIEDLKNNDFYASEWVTYRAPNCVAYWASAWSAYRASNCAAYWAADRAADCSAAYAAEREVQLQILIEIVKKQA